MGYPLGFTGAGGATALAGSGRGCFAQPTVLTNTVLSSAGPRCGAAAIAFVISLVILSGYRSGPRWLMALADCDAAEMLGAFDAGIG